jgi:hypothetical protein
MNIFALDDDPIYAAMYQCDKHVVKMTLETAQLLSSAHHMIATPDFPAPSGIYATTHQHHPSTLWTAKTSGNYAWLYNHFAALAGEYTYRFGKTHKSWVTLKHKLWQPPRDINHAPRTPFAQAMPDEYKHSDPVTAYRTYYVADKADFLKYSRRPAPWWVDVYRARAERAKSA